MLKGTQAVVGSKILCKLFAAQKSAKIDARGMKGTWGDLVFCTALLRKQGSSMSIHQLNGAVLNEKMNISCAAPHTAVPNITHIAVPDNKA